MYPLRAGISMGLAMLCALKSAATDTCFESASTTSTLVQSYYPPAANCQNYFIPVTYTANILDFNGTEWETDYDLENFLALATTRASANFPTVLTGPKSETHTVQIAASFCTPNKKNGKEKTVILATHGIGPARAHWNSPFQPEKYNFVQWATGQGYSVFFYDRLGTGASQKVSGYSAQLNTAAAVLQELAGAVRSGKYTGSIGKPNKLALMGFSFGSYTVHTAVIEQPQIADAVILTAIGFNKTGLNPNGLLRSFVPRIASAQNPILYGDRDTGYVTWVDKFAQINNYFKQPNYDPAAADFAEFAKQPFAIAEFLTLLSGPTDASDYRGPVLAITGQYDYIFCDGYCPGLLEEPGRQYYRNAKYFPVVHPGASHNLNFHHNATGAYKVITDFLGQNGL